VKKEHARSTSDAPIVRYLDRVRRREERHGNWRQIYLDCLGMCQFPLEEGIICGETEGLEFHEQFGEAKGEELKLQQRVLLCNYHHWSVHGQKWVNQRHYPSMLQTDVDIEVKLCGSFPNWIEHYNLIERRVDYDFEEDTTKLANDLDDSESS